jgi:2-polyprenyl-3-methyl-5-hydroxy-6-metoxy-1,4-benzoquinol methylase
MKKHQYQKNFSDLHNELYNYSERMQKANKIIAVLEDYFKDGFKNLKLLDIGSSTGIITKALSEKFSVTIGIDIDEKAIKYSKENFENNQLHFFMQDSMNINFPDNSFDVINCTHIYEHVPDSQQLMREIYRILKPNGVCFFSAANRLVLMEAHYKLPLLSVMPKWMAHKYIKLFNKASFYYETHLTYWSLKKIVSKFEIIDYTRDVIKRPLKYYATEMIKDKSLTQFLFLFILKIAYWSCPTYIWLLKKPN